MLSAIVFAVGAIASQQAEADEVHKIFNEAVADMRFKPAGAKDLPEEYWPLQSNGIRFRVGLIGINDSGFQGYAEAVFVCDAGFDPELLNDVSEGYGYGARIDILGRLVVKSILHLPGMTVDQCKRAVSGFAWTAGSVARQSCRDEGAFPVSLPVPSGRKSPLIVLDESRKVKFISTLDLDALADYWGFHASFAAGSTVAYYYNCQYKGTTISIVQDVENHPGSVRHSIIYGVYVTAQVAIDDSEGFAKLKGTLPGWEVSDLGDRTEKHWISVRKHFAFGDGATLESFKEFLVKAVTELKATERQGGSPRLVQRKLSADADVAPYGGNMY